MFEAGSAAGDSHYGDNQKAKSTPVRRDLAATSHARQVPYLHQRCKTRRRPTTPVGLRREAPLRLLGPGVP